MSHPDVLVVWYRDRIVGRLTRDSTNRMGFRYEDSWRGSGGFAVSVSLPLSQEVFPPAEAVAHRFFANLLPEGEARRRVVIESRIPDSDFDLLRAIGGECAGALSLRPDDREPTGEARYAELSAPDLANLIRSRGRTPVARGEPHPRLSLAGAQDKCPILIRDDRFHLPLGEAPSSHILKFTIPDYSHVPAYEAVLTDLARRIGLTTCDVEFRRLSIGSNSLDFLVIKRFDRVATSDGGLERLHQEDFCQALGVGPERKYEDDGGVDFASCYKLVRDVSTEPALDAIQLLRWQMFNLLAGNSDGHAKNLALLYQDDRTVRLAPFYDLVCTRAIENVNARLAFAVGSERVPGDVRVEHWERLATDLKIGARYVRRLVREAAEGVQAQAGAAVEAFQERHGDYPALQRVVSVVNTQCRRVLREE